MSLHTHLGKLGKKLPELRKKEWENIFEFIEYFLSVEFDEKSGSLPSIQWRKVSEILDVLEKVKD